MLGLTFSLTAYAMKFKKLFEPKLYAVAAYTLNLNIYLTKLAHTRSVHPELQQAREVCVRQELAGRELGPQHGRKGE